MTAALQNLDPLTIDMVLTACERLYGGEILPATPEVVQTRRELIAEFARDNKQPPDTMHSFALCSKCGLDNSDRTCAVLENFVTSSVDEFIAASTLVAGDQFRKIRCKKCQRDTTVYVDVHSYSESAGRDMVVRTFEGSEGMICSYQLLWMDRTGAFSHMSDDEVGPTVIEIDATDLTVEEIIDLFE